MLTEKFWAIYWAILFAFVSCSDLQEDKHTVGDAHPADINAEKLALGALSSCYPIPADEWDLGGGNARFDTVNLFRIRDLTENAGLEVGFISVSDIYALSTNTDSLAIPDPKHIPQEKSGYLVLTDRYRDQLLAITGISERDSVFVYDYSQDILFSFSVQSLNTVAYLNEYYRPAECPCIASDYMYGFAVDKRKLPGLARYFSDVYVYVGSHNPFVRGQMQAIQWQAIPSEKFPAQKIQLSDEQMQRINSHSKIKRTYLSERNGYQFYVQDYLASPEQTTPLYRHVLILDQQTGIVVNELLFRDSEGGSPAPLNFGINDPNHPNLKQQWVGKLIKGHSPVVFGFVWMSFGCPPLFYIEPNAGTIQFQCDNRH